MEKRIEQPVSVPAIADILGVGERTLEMLFFLQTVGLSPRDYYLNLRMKEGRRHVLDTRKSITTIAIQTGFSSASTFARRFRATFGASQRQVRQRLKSRK